MSSLGSYTVLSLGFLVFAGFLYAPASAPPAARCTATTACDAWLASGRRDGFDSFCPNADFVGRCAP